MKQRKNILLIGGENPLIESARKALEKESKLTYLSDKELNSSKKVRNAGRMFSDQIDLLIVDLFTPARFQKQSLEELTEDSWKDYKYKTVKYMYDIGKYFVNERLGKDLEILLLTSIGGVLPLCDNMLVCGGNAAAIMFTQVLAEELSDSHVIANCIAVGYNDGKVGINTKNEEELLLHIPTHEALCCEKLGEQIANIALTSKYGQTGNVIKLDDAFSVSYMREY